MAYLKHNGLYLGIDPYEPTKVYADRTVAGSWEEVVAEPYAGGYTFRARVANRMIRLREDHVLVSYPAGQNDGWGGWWAVQGSQASIDGFTLDVEGLSVLEPLRIAGLDFVHPDGSKRVLKGIDAFWLYRAWLDGNLGAVNNLLAEAQELGFDMLRVFGMGSKAQNTVHDLWPSREPQYYPQLRPFVDYLNSKGFVVLFTVFVDAQDVMPSQSDRYAHWNAVASHLRGSVTLLSQGNERDKNGTRDDFVSDPGMYFSRGSWTQDPDPFKPKPEGASFAEFHPRRDLWAALFDTVASPVTIWERDHVNVPLICDEPPRFGTNGSGELYTNPVLAWKFYRHYATEFASAVFHNYFSQRGLLMDEPTRACAAQAVRGMTI